MRLLQAGVDTTVIALWLGHENVETTQIYLHAVLELKERAIARTTYRHPTRALPTRRHPRLAPSLLAFCRLTERADFPLAGARDTSRQEPQMAAALDDTRLGGGDAQQYRATPDTRGETCGSCRSRKGTMHHGHAETRNANKYSRSILATPTS